jgi:hypothetical protein
MSPSDLRKAIRNFSIEAYCKSNRPSLPPDELALQKCLGLTAPDLPRPSSTIWHHATRVVDPTTFSQGLLPLNERAEPLAALLDRLAAEPEPLSDVSDEFYSHEGGRHFSEKTQNPMHSGPCAFLVRDAILSPDSATHDYLATPEIVEDIAGLRFGANAPALLDRFRKHTTPCIVQFEDETRRSDTVLSAFHYVYCHYWDLLPSHYANTCFDANGSTIPPSAIRRVEVINWP